MVFCLFDSFKSLYLFFNIKKQVIYEKESLLKNDKIDELEYEEENPIYINKLEKYNEIKKNLSTDEISLLDAILKQIQEGDIPKSIDININSVNDKISRDMYRQWSLLKGYEISKAKLKFINEIDELQESDELNNLSE